MLVANQDSALCLDDNGANKRRALLVRLVGKASNRDGIGARLRLTIGSTTLMREVKAGSSYLGQNDTRVLFGLGDSGVADRLEVRWPSGRMEVVERVPANSIVTLSKERV